MSETTYKPVSLKPAIEGQLSPDERIGLYKRFIKTEEKRIFKSHREGAGGVEVAKARGELIDKLLATILQATIDSQQIDSSPVALVAIGGYGRGTLNPGSDIDLLFLLPRASTKLPTNVQELVQRVLYVLWDMGFKVGQSCRSIAECVEQARLDQQNFTSLMDTRLISGNKQLYDDLLVRFEKDCITKSPAAFLETRRTDLRSRYKKSSYTVFLQEPNVKESCGGLRDYQNILWVARVKTGSGDLQKLVDDRLITKNTFKEIEEAYDFLMRVRNDLHYHSGKATDILTLQLQGVVATAFKYPQRSILRRTETFMRDYYRHTRHLYRHTNSLMETFEIQQDKVAETGLRSFLTFRKKNREEFDGFIATDGRIYPSTQDIFKEDPHRLMRMFQHCQVRELRLSPPMRRLIASHWGDIDRPFRYLKANRETFQAILERKGEAARTLRQMHRIGFLGRYLPEFGALDCLVQHEFFHRYTADEHTLRCIDELDKLIDNTDPRLHIFRRLFHQIVDPYALYVALILHDTGRSENVREHIDGSAMLAIKLCSRLQITGRRRAMIIFLVDNHLTFWRTATTKNLEDPEVVAEFAGIMKTQEKLDALLLFTYCDTSGTAPDAWNGWKEMLMLQLHKATLRFLAEGKEKFNRKLDSDREELRAEVIALMSDESAEDIRKHFERTPSAAFTYREASFISTQIKAVRKFLEEEKNGSNPYASSLEWIDHPVRGYSELIVATRDRPLHLEKLCCALASEQINILSADLFTRTDSIVLNIFRVCTTNFEPITTPSTRKRFASTFTSILESEKYEPETYLKLKANFLKPRTETGLSVPVRAHVSNDLHPTCTTVEIQALDRIGLLHDLFFTVNEAGLDTSHARICTEKGVAMDTLYITTHDDKQILDPELLSALEEKFNNIVAREEG
ncbi:MAG: [protein-PII] uridylyltransferase [Verrucomicrobia bacterium]|jgi:[protein-PII] uridylyltransferase|nr:[protein-PII] uridylyltransferase [Verrucomicrobiota bacterium]|tara:strand:- start:5943 stop:8678 length:2736 start_codon:yes stop_codon:yes gene_type:complete